MKLVIQTNIYNYLGLLLEGCEHFDEEILAERREKQPDGSGNIAFVKKRNLTKYSVNAQLKALSDWLLKVMASANLDAIFPASTQEYTPLVEELWNDSAIQATYRRINELQSLPSNASYFLERLIRIHTKDLGENCKWLGMVEDVHIVIFSIAIATYNEYYEDTDGMAANWMMENKKLFECIASQPSFQHTYFLLILSKFTEWFDDYSPVSSQHLSNKTSRDAQFSAIKVQQAFHYIATKLKRLLYSSTGHKLYVTLVNVDAALRYAKEIIKCEDESMAYCTSESMYTTELNSYSH